jgi:hypothetical protein
MKTRNLLLAVTFLLTVIFLFPAFSFGQGVWTQKASFPGTGRYLAASFSIGTKGYVGIGYPDITTTNAFRDFWEWDQATNVWTKKADYPGASGGVVANFSIGTKGYIATGQSNYEGGFTNELWEYNPATNTWTQKASLPSIPERSWGVGFSIGTKGYIGTGSKDVGMPSQYFQDFWEWDQATNVWTQKANFGGTARSYAVGFAIGTKGYIGTGEDIIGGKDVDKKDFWEWDQATNVWTKKADFGGTARGYAKGFSTGTKGYIVMGLDAAWNTFNDVWEWDQNTNIWVQKANFGGTARAHPFCFSIGNKGYIGTGGNGTLSYQDFWEYNPSGTTGITEVAKENIFVYPNPATDIITLNFNKRNNADLTLNIYNITGELVSSETLLQNQQQINIGEISNGIYLVEIKSNGWSEKQKLIIQR